MERIDLVFKGRCFPQKEKLQQHHQMMMCSHQHDPSSLVAAQCSIGELTGNDSWKV